MRGLLYCFNSEQGGRDPLAALVKTSGGSKRNALLKWCQSKTMDYKVRFLHGKICLTLACAEFR